MRAAPGHAPASQRVGAQLRMELRLLARNGENLLVTLGIPVGLLVFFSLVEVLPTGDGPAVDFLVPGVLALSVMSAGMVALGISTGFERAYLVLKRFGATPLRRGELVTAKILAVLAVQAVQVIVVIAVGAGLLGWRPAAGAGGIGLAAAGLLLGTAAFCGIGLAMAGRLPALATLAVANACFVVLLLVSGILFPTDVLPGPLAAGAHVLPAAPLADLLRAAFDGAGAPVGALAVLSGWAVGAPVLAGAVFRWE